MKKPARKVLFAAQAKIWKIEDKLFDGCITDFDFNEYLALRHSTRIALQAEDKKLERRVNMYMKKQLEKSNTLLRKELRKLKNQEISL